jgi:hypothetical protein
MRLLPHLLSGFLKKRPSYTGEYTLDILPHDVCVYMMSFLPIREIPAMSVLNRHFFAVCESDALWEWFCELKWREITRNQSNESRTAGPEAVQSSVTSIAYDAHARKFIDSLRKGYSGSYKDMFMTLVSLPLVDNSIVGEGLFNWLGCYDEHSPYILSLPYNPSKMVHLNPAEITAERIHKVRVVASSQKTGKHTDWISRKNTACWTENTSGEFFRVDLGRNLSFVPTHYQMRYGSKGGKVLPKSWVMQGSNDAHQWFNLRVHENDTTFTKTDYCLGTWNIESYFGESFRYFRVMLTDKTNSTHADWDNTLVATGFELFGFAIAPPQFHADMREYRVSKISDLIYAISQKADMQQVISRFQQARLTDVNQVVTAFGETLTHISAQYNHEECLKWLVEQKNAAIDTPMDSGESVFYVTTNIRMKDYLYSINSKRMEQELKKLRAHKDNDLVRPNRYQSGLCA